MQVYATVTLGLLVNKGAWCSVWGGSIRGQGPPTSSSYERMWLAMPGLLLRAVCLRNSRERVHGSSLLPFLQISRQHIPLNLNIFVWDFNPVCLTLEPISFLPWTSRLLPQLEQNLVMQWLLPPSSVLSATLPAVRLCVCLHCFAPGHCWRIEFISFSISICVVTLWWLREPKHAELIQALSKNQRMRQLVNGTEQGWGWEMEIHWAFGSCAPLNN